MLVCPKDADKTGKTASLQDKQALNRFIQEAKAAQEQAGDMFDENEEAEQEALNQKGDQAANISQTGASVDD